MLDVALLLPWVSVNVNVTQSKNHRSFVGLRFPRSVVGVSAHLKACKTYNNVDDPYSGFCNTLVSHTWFFRYREDVHLARMLEPKWLRIVTSPLLISSGRRRQLVL